MVLFLLLLVLLLLLLAYYLNVSYKDKNKKHLLERTHVRPRLALCHIFSHDISISYLVWILGLKQTLPAHQIFPSHPCSHSRWGLAFRSCLFYSSVCHAFLPFLYLLLFFLVDIFVSQWIILIPSKFQCCNSIKCSMMSWKLFWAWFLRWFCSDGAQRGRLVAVNLFSFWVERAGIFINLHWASTF